MDLGGGAVVTRNQMGVPGPHFLSDRGPSPEGKGLLFTEACDRRKMALHSLVIIRVKQCDSASRAVFSSPQGGLKKAYQMNR